MECADRLREKCSAPVQIELESAPQNTMDLQMKTQNIQDCMRAFNDGVDIYEKYYDRVQC